MNQSQSPQKTMNKSSQDIPSTATRTSTRRKTTQEEPQSTQPTTRTRRMTRRTMELDEENKNVHVPETPGMATTTRRRAQKTESEVEEPKKSDLLETPALQSGRRRPGVGSTRRKVEAQKEGSVQQGYGTRRSVRLLDKCMAGSSLKESEIMEPVKIDEMAEDETEENKNGQSEAPVEVPLARNLSVSLEDEMDLKDDVLENSKCYHSGGNDCTVISEAGSRKSDNLDAKDASPNEKPDESDAYLAKSADKLADMSNGTIYPKGSDYLSVSEDSYEIDNLNEDLVAEKNVESHADAEAFEEISEEALDHSSSAEFMEPIEVVSVEEYAANHAAQEIECQKLVGKDFEINVVMLNDNLAKLPEAEEYDGGKVSQNILVGNEESEDDPDQIVTGSNILDVFLGDLDTDDDTGSDNNSKEEVSCEQISISIPTAAYSSEDPMTNTVNEEALVDVNVAEAEIIHVLESSFHNAPQSVVGDIPIQKKLYYGDAEASVDVCVKPAEEIPPEEKSPTAAKLMSHCPSLISNGEITTPIPLAAQFSQPTRLTPRKSSSMKQTTIPKVIQVSDNNNKENIDNNSSKEVEPNLGKVKKNKNIINEETMQKLEGMSLRNLKKLTKMFDKIRITDNMKNKEDKNVSKPLGKTRPALQTLPQNCMSTGEAEKQN
ncbi:hypothetical protein CRYUN_Cryun16bG0054200 [Craigia yunnanensis]